MIGAKIAAGLLPLATEPRQRVGKGSGCSCAACDKSITHAEVEYEVSIGSRRVLHFHRLPHRVERRALRPVDRVIPRVREISGDARRPRRAEVEGGLPTKDR